MAKTMKGVVARERKGTVYWYARVDGRRVYCGKGAKGKELAEAARSKYVGKRYENREVAAGLKTRRAEFRTVKELSDWYMVLPGNQRKKNYRRRVANAKHLLAYFGTMPLGDVDGTVMERYRAQRQAAGAAAGTVNNEIALLSAMFHLALKDKKLLPDQMPGRFPLEKARNPRRCITAAEYAALRACALDQQFRDLLTCAWESAMRSSEISGLTVGQVHLGVRHISGAVVDYIDLGIFDTKTQTRRTVPVSAELKTVLQRCTQGKAADDVVFLTAEGVPFTTTTICNRLVRACGRAKIPYGDKVLNGKGERLGIVFHCFRHTRTTRWVEAGFSDEIIRRATGHASLEAYRTYVKLDPSAVMRLVGTQSTQKPGRSLRVAEV
jgi:integrase